MKHPLPSQSTAYRIDAAPWHPIDRHLADFLVSLAATPSHDLYLAAALASRETRQGSTCINLEKFAGRDLENENGLPTGIRCPNLADWSESLLQSGVAGQEGSVNPLVLHDSRLYLYRYWFYENGLAQEIRTRVGLGPPPLDMGKLKEILARLFPDHPSHDGPDWQKVAAFTACANRISFISGGPGTGKTTTVSAILAALTEIAPSSRLKLAAPTGKSAQRLQQSMASALSALNLPDDVKARIPARAHTLHRLLGTHPNSSQTRYHAKRPLPLDTLIIDECSMVDLPMMYRLMQALPGEARMVMVGDKDQLVSVEVGTVFGDLCGAGREAACFTPSFLRAATRICGPLGDSSPTNSLLTDTRVKLQKNFRFSSDSGIARLGKTVRAGNPGASLRLLQDAQIPDIEWHPPQRLPHLLAEKWVEEFKAAISFRDDPAKALRRLNSFGVLAALREGPAGENGLNNQVIRILSAGELRRGASPAFPGCPIMIRQNDYGMRLFNGDLGLFLPDENDQLRAFFPGEDETVRSLAPGLLPKFTTAFAVTVHKSQGSEFDTVLLVLPQRHSPVLTRELLYTAVTRARRKFCVVAAQEVLEKTISSRVSRTGRLGELFETPSV